MEASAATRPTHSGPRVPARLLRLASDERLVAHVRGGSEAAFEALFDRHHRGILAFCRHMLGSPEEAEDAVQHTFMAAYRSLIGSRRPIQLRAWLYTIARNRCLSVLRARRETPTDHLDELPTENLSGEVQRRQDLRDLLHDVGGLPEKQRSALVLAEVGGVSHDEIAQVLDVPREKVKALVFQARSSLIASRDARDTPCEDIRIQLSELRGGALRRNSLRRHLKVCPGCRDFRSAVQDQRKLLAVALPVAPTLLLKQGVMAVALGSGAAAAGGTVAAGGLAGAFGGGSLLAGGGAAMTAKVLAIAAIAGGGVAGFKAAIPSERAGSPAAPAAQGGAVPGTGTGRSAEAERGLGGAAPAEVGSREQRPSDTGPGVAEQRSHGRRGTEQRSDVADERAAGPNPEVLKDPAKPVNERSLERGEGGGPGEKSQPERAEPEATLRRPEVEKRDKPAAPTEREKAPKPVLAPVAEPELEPVVPIATVAPVPTVLPDAAANGKAIADAENE